MNLSRIEDRRRRRRFAPSLTSSSTRTTSIQAIKAAIPISEEYVHYGPGLTNPPSKLRYGSGIEERWMEATVTRAGATARELSGAGIIAAIKASGIEYILSVPDIVTSAGLLAPIAKDKDLRLIRVCKEDECIGIATGLAYSDKRALVLIQHTGFLDSINAIRGVAVEYKQPICMMIGLLQHDPDKAPKESPRYGVRIVEPILDDMGIAHHLLGVDADIAKIKPAIDKAYAESQPVAFLVGRSPKQS
jgi:sulfopyruvate decarboxylase subunit alpha